MGGVRKLTDWQARYVRRIGRLRQAVPSRVELAELFGVSVQVIEQIEYGNTYKHIAARPIHYVPRRLAVLAETGRSGNAGAASGDDAAA